MEADDRRMKRKPDSSITQEFVEKARLGDREALGTLLQRYRQRLEALIHLRLGPQLREKVEVEDVLQETYLNAIGAIQKFQWTDQGSFFRWLGAIAEHVIQRSARFHLQTEKRKYSRERSLERHLDGTEGRPADLAKLLRARDPSPSTILQRQERFDRLEAALNQLHPDHREVIILAAVRGLPTRDIAAQLGRSREAVSMLLLRALRRLRKEFGRTDSFHLPLLGLASLPGISSGCDDPEDPGRPPTSNGSLQPPAEPESPP